MISKFGLRDFKGHRDTQLALGRFTMLVGDNASGKTSVLDALALQPSLGSRPAAVLRGSSSPKDILRRTSQGPIVLASEGIHHDLGWSATFRLHHVPTDSDVVKKPWILELVSKLGGNSFDGQWHAQSMSASHAWQRAWESIAAPLGTARVYRWRAERISASAYSDQPGAPIETDGTNTAVVLAAMKLGDDEAFNRVEHALRKLIPSIERIRLRPATVRLRPATARRRSSNTGNVVGNKIYFDFRGASSVPAHGASHGTLIVLALLAVLHGANRPNLVLLDDFDHALHPRAQIELMRMIKNLLALDEFKDVQVVATTHSPYVLDELDSSDVYAFALREDGTVASKRLSEHPEAERTRGTLKSGQLWSLDPERDWVLRG
jgi:predicted ATPase